MFVQTTALFWSLFFSCDQIVFDVLNFSIRAYIDGLIQAEIPPKSLLLRDNAAEGRPGAEPDAHLKRSLFGSEDE